VSDEEFCPRCNERESTQACKEARDHSADVLPPAERLRRFEDGPGRRLKEAQILTERRRVEYNTKRANIGRTEYAEKSGGAVGRPSCRSSLLSDPNAKFSAETWRKPSVDNQGEFRFPQTASTILTATPPGSASPRNRDSQLLLIHCTSGCLPIPARGSRSRCSCRRSTTGCL
jgi:hypothetical protein